MTPFSYDSDKKNLSTVALDFGNCWTILQTLNMLGLTYVVLNVRDIYGNDLRVSFHKSATIKVLLRDDGNCSKRGKSLHT